MKKKKVILLTSLVVLMLGFLPTVLAAAENRPISAFTATNDGTNVLGWGDPETGLAAFPHGFWWHPEVISDCEHWGSVQVKELKDGRISYKINLHVKGAVLWVMAVPDYVLIFTGEIDYYFSTVLIVEGVISDPVPNLIDVWFGGGESPFSHITGTGSGTFTADAGTYGFIPGDTAKLKLNQVAIAKPPDHPQIDPEYDPISMWPVELVFFH
jgi:hypothetical protein